MAKTHHRPQTTNHHINISGQGDTTSLLNTRNQAIDCRPSSVVSHQLSGGGKSDGSRDVCSGGIPGALEAIQTHRQQVIDQACIWVLSGNLSSRRLKFQMAALFTPGKAP